MDQADYFFLGLICGIVDSICTVVVHCGFVSLQLASQAVRNYIFGIGSLGHPYLINIKANFDCF